ncbi:MAG: hypothetical protein Q7S95_02660 [bacterium]|nr:hypothetical protein [bacterium]
MEERPMFVDFSGGFPLFPAARPPRRYRERAPGPVESGERRLRSNRLPVEADLARARSRRPESQLVLVLPR